MRMAAELVLASGFPSPLPHEEPLQPPPRDCLPGSILTEQDAARRKHMLHGWSVLYCGGKGPVLSELKRIKAEVGIPVAVEAFYW